MRKAWLSAFISMVLALPALAQAPVIHAVEPQTLYPKGTVIITGNGFSSTPSDLQVWFGHVKGIILTSSQYAIEVEVPAQARLSAVEVINLTTRLSAKADIKFMPSFYGAPFVPTKFTSPLSFTEPKEIWDLCSCDLDNDTKPEIISTKFDDKDLVVLHNQSTPGNLAFTKLLQSLDFPTDHIACGDLEGDGKPDLVVTRSGSPRNTVHILKNTSAGAGSFTFAAPIELTMEVGRFATRTVLRDLNKDGKPEIVVSNSFDNILYIYLNQSANGVLNINVAPIKLTVTGALASYGISVEDFDGDGLPDIIAGQFQASDLFIFRNQSAGAVSFAPVQKMTVSGNLNKIISADFNNDGLPDIAITSTLNNQAYVLINQSTPGSFSFRSPITLTTSTGPWGIDVSDIDGDQDPDIIIANRNQQTLDVFLHSGNFATPAFSKTNIATAKPSRNVIAGDLDGDAKPDLAFTSFNASISAYSLDILRNTNCHQPAILNEQPLAVCSGQTITLKSIPALNVTFTWQKDAATIKTGPDAFVDITTAGSYAVTATGDGCSLSASLTITSSAATVPSDPVITANSPLCTGSTLNLSTATVAGGTYNWTGPNGFSSTAEDPAPISNVTAANAGLYSLQVSVGNCRSNVATKRVDIADLDDFSISSTVASNTICQGSSLFLSVNDLAGYTYQWKKNGATIGGQTTAQLEATTEGSYSVVVENAALSCIREIGPTAVTVFTAPVAAFQAKATACTNENVSFTNQSTTDSRATALYSWTFGDTKTSSDPNPVHAYTTANAFSVALTVTYAGMTGCSHNTSKPITITGSIPPVITASPVSICPGEPSTLSIAGTYTAVNWSHGASGNPVSVDQPGNYTVNANDVNGCPVSDEITLGQRPTPQLTVSAEKPVIAPGESVQLTASGADTYAWSPAESLNDPAIANPTATPTATTLYTVTGALTGGCAAVSEITITVDGSMILISPAVAFSPNGDGANETWTIDGVESYSDCTLSVFDGRGRRIYQKQGYTNDWDGTYQGKPVPDGTYYYVFGCPDKKPSTGSVLIFR